MHGDDVASAGVSVSTQIVSKATEILLDMLKVAIEKEREAARLKQSEKKQVLSGGEVTYQKLKEGGEVAMLPSFDKDDYGEFLKRAKEMDIPVAAIQEHGKENTLSLFFNVKDKEAVNAIVQDIVREKLKQPEQTERMITIEKEQAEINAYKDEIAKLKSRLTQKEERLDERKDKVIRSATEEAQRILREAKETADQTIKQINKLTAGAGINKELEEQRSRLRDQLKKTDDKLAVKAKGPSQPISPKKLKIGDGVKVLSMNLKGTVSTLPNAKGDLYVQMGILRSLVNIRDLELLNEKDINATLGDGSSISYGGKSPAKGKGSGSSQIKVSKSATISTEVNLIGMTVDEALPVMEKYLDDAYLAHLPSVRVVHGRGTGALKNAVHKRLRQLKYVKEFRLGQFGEGDSGVTVVTFK